MPFLLVFGLLLFASANIIAWWRIYLRVGWSPYLAPLMVIPYANIAILLFFAFGRWPIEQRMEALAFDLKRLRGEL